MSSAVEILRVGQETSLEAFIDLPWRLYPAESLWVPPLKSDMRRMLSVDLHPFWQFSEQALFVAVREGVPVGRIAGIVDHNYNRFHNERMGIWGFFECENDPEAAAALFEAAERWVRQKGMHFLRGPLNPSTNYEIGMLLEGFDLPPVIMMPWNPPYYLDLVEGCGFAKEKDLVALLITPDNQASHRVERLAKRIRRNNNVWVRPGNRDRFLEELAILKEIYHASFAPNWGFVPMTDAELDEMGHRLLKIVDPDLVLFIYYEDEPVGITLILPDINPLLKRLGGKIGITGVWKYLRYRHEIRGYRGVLFGFKQRYQGLGLPIVAFEHINRVLREKKARYLELGWNLEDNDDINQFDREVGGEVYKKYRIFRKNLV